VAYASWRLKQSRAAAKPVIRPAFEQAREHAEWARQFAEVTHGRRWADAEIKLGPRRPSNARGELVRPHPDKSVMLVQPCGRASQRRLIHTAADVLCQDLFAPNDRRAAKQLVLQDRHEARRSFAAGGFQAIAGIDENEILMPY